MEDARQEVAVTLRFAVLTAAGYKPAEIAEELGVPVEQLRAARTRLKAAMSKQSDTN
jgi:DNA-directed RNA polymerase specialized sigma24 family protein